jgi:LysR family glycine cleavage system transcriptional activator
MALRSDWLPALAAFEAAARHQNFAHAAEELHLTASAVSHHVRRLEARLGVPLFQRHARGVALTAEGRQLADTAGSALADMDDVLRGLRAGREGEAVVRIATLHSWTCGWLLPRLPGFAATHPDIGLSIETGFALARFDDGGPDLGIRHGAGVWPGLTAQPLLQEDLFPVTSPTMAGIEHVQRPADIARLPLIADTARQGWHDWFRAAGVRGVEVGERYRFSDSNAALTAAALGLGVALARERIVAPFLEDGRLVALPGPRMRGRWSYYLIHPTHRRLRPPAQAFADWLLAQPRE